jgi:long-chain fatty acid transport protein
MSVARAVCLCVVFTLAYSAIAAKRAHAAGPWLYEGGTPDMGTATAGRQALAEDASTARGNPAGMIRLECSEVLIGLQPFQLTLKFDSGSDTDVAGNDGDDAGGFNQAGGLYAVHKLTDDWAVGLYAGSAFALKLNYDENWVGRYQIQRRSLITAHLLPSIAYRLTEWFSMGGGIGLEAGSLYQKTAINNSLDDLPDGRLRFKDESIEPFAQLGILVEPGKGTRLGAIYTSQAEHTFKDGLQLRGLGPMLEAALAAEGLLDNRVEFKVKRPQQVQTSLYQDLNERLAVMASLGWQDFSSFGRVQVSIRSTTTDSFTSNRNFKDAWHFAFGAKYRLDDSWSASSGIALDTSPVRNQDRTPDAPADRQIRVGAGLQYQRSEKLSFGLTYTYVDLGNGKLDSDGGPLGGRVQGKYKDAHIHFAGVQLRRQF